MKIFLIAFIFSIVGISLAQTITLSPQDIQNLETQINKLMTEINRDTQQYNIEEQQRNMDTIGMENINAQEENLNAEMQQDQSLISDAENKLLSVNVVYP